MLRILHRVNSKKELLNTPREFGVEIDIRSNKENLYLHHDPFMNGEDLKGWLEGYNHSGLILNGISALTYVYALKFGDLSVLYPVAGLSYIWISIISMKYLGEKMNGYKWLGVSLIVLGVVYWYWCLR